MDSCDKATVINIKGMATSALMNFMRRSGTVVIYKTGFEPIDFCNTLTSHCTLRPSAS